MIDWWCYRCGVTRNVAVCPICGLKAPRSFVSENDSVHSTLEDIQSTLKSQPRREDESTLNDLKRTVESQPRTAHRAMQFVIAVLLWLVIRGWAENMWNSRAVLALRYTVSTDQITTDEEPHDCDFLRAPLGDKGCSYAREITVIKTGTNAAGEHFVTYDNGKTWTPDPQQQAKSSVMVWWKKQ